MLLFSIFLLHYPRSGSPPPPDMNTPAPRLTRVLLATMAAGTFSARAQQPVDPQDFPDNRNSTSAALGAGLLGMAWTTTRDPGGHLYRNRAGLRPGNHIVESEAPVVSSGSKGGMASAKGAKVAAIAVPVPNRWNVYGSIFYYSDDQDGESYRRRSKKKDDKKDDKKHKHDKYDKYDLSHMMVARAPIAPGGAGGVATGSTDSTLDVWGGSVGVEYHVNRNWTIGLAVAGASGELRMDGVGSSDVDSLSLNPYVSYYREDTLGSADLWGSLMYGYGMHSFDTNRYTGGGIASGSPDATTNTVEFNVGLNFGDDDFVHGPYAGMRYITGSIDAYTEVGPGGTYFGEQDVDSLVSILGYQASWKIRGDSGFWVPQLRVGWEHEFEDGNTTAFGIPVSNYDEDLAVVGAGIGYYWDNGWNVGLDYEGRYGSNTASQYGAVRAGKEF